MTKFYLLSILIVAFWIQNTFGQNTEITISEPRSLLPNEISTFSIIYGKKGDGLPKRMKIRGIIEDVTFVPFGCGIMFWYGSAKIKLLDRVKGYGHEYVYVVAPCLTNNKENFLNKIVAIKVSKLRRGRMPDPYLTGKSPFDSKGLAFYNWDEKQN